MLEKDTARLNAYIDGELTHSERAQVEAWIAQDEGARSILESLKEAKLQTQAAEPNKQDLDAAWQRFAAQAEASPQSQTTSQPQTPKGRPFIRFPLAISGLAASLLLGFAIWFHLPNSPQTDQYLAEALSQSVEMVETDLEDSSSIVYIDPDSGWTVVWVESTLEDTMNANTEEVLLNI